MTIKPKIGFLYASSYQPFYFSLSGTLIGFDLDYRNNFNVHTLSLGFNKDFEIFSSPACTYQELNYLYGRYDDKAKIRFQYQIGVGVFFGNEQDKLIRRDPGLIGHSYYTMKSYSTIAIPLKLGIYRLFKKGRAFGIDMNININNKYIFISPTLGYEF